MSRKSCGAAAAKGFKLGGCITLQCIAAQVVNSSSSVWGTAEKQGREKWGLISVCDMCKIWSVEEREEEKRRSSNQRSGRQLFDPLVMVS